MGKGIDLARPEAQEHTALLDDLKDQLLVALVLKAGGKLSISVAEVDATGGHVLAFRLDVVNRVFHFETREKQ